MTYDYEIHPKCSREINKLSKRNSLLEKVLKRKINEILKNPSHYKPLKYDLAGERRVHILKSFVLKFSIDENQKTITFLAFAHHDKAY